ncbi:peptidoglycan recognition family protein [Paenibacillus sp. NPDC057967]|uniref:peptidoglycan recognition protein family protein n=1 Tax=Paenibacillus sp. NPDC057967 TaxID=3346293 RepID=UPI0036DAA57A
MRIIDLRGKLPVHATYKYKTRKLSDIRSFAIHHSLTFSGSAEAFARYHVTTNAWPGIGYTYVVGRDGTVYQCWDHTVVSYHVGNSNKHALGICLVGDFRTQLPTQEQYAAALELVRWLRQQLPNATNVLGHSEYPDYAWKACPVISMTDFRKNIDKKQEDDKMTAAEAKAFAELQQTVRSQKDQLEAQSNALKAATERIEAPKWFVEEFGGNVEKLIHEPTFSKEGWRTLAVALRAQSQLQFG